MRRTLFTCLLGLFTFCAKAQTAGSPPMAGAIDTSFMSFTTVAEAVGIPATYKIVSYQIIYSSKKEVFRMVNWSAEQLRQLCSRAAKGDVLIIDEIVVEKDGKRAKWKDKTFTF